MNALDREVGELIAQHLHDQDPRYVWTVKPATAPGQAQPPSAPEAQDDRDRRATRPAPADRHAA